MSKTKRRLGYLFAVIALAVGCRKEDDRELTSEEVDEVAASVGALIADSGEGSVTAGVEAAATAALGEEPANLHVVTGRPGTYTGTRTGTLGDAQWSFGWDIEVDCRDVSGDTLDACSDATDAADVNVDVNGMYTGAQHQIAASWQAGWTLTTLSSGSGTLDGGGAYALEWNTERAIFADSTFELDASVDAQEVRFPLTATTVGDVTTVETGTPTSGRFVYDVDGRRTVTGGIGNRDDEINFHADVVVEFANTGATVTVCAERTATRRYNLNAATGQVTFHSELQTAGCE